MWKHKPGLTLAERQQQMRDKAKAKKVVIAYSLKNDLLRRARLFKLHKYLGITDEEYAEALGISPFELKRMRQGSPVPVALVKLAEALRTKQMHHNKYERRKIKDAAAKLQLPEVVTPEVRQRVVLALVMGKTVDQIAAEESLRPEIVREIEKTLA